jgi:radical SAM superfamily enzyme YgiQ (UPF0313 family)
MKPNVLFVVLPYVKETHTFLGFPYGLLSVVTYNKDLANIKIVDLNTWDKIDDFKFLTILREFKPDIVGFTMMYDNSYKHLGQLLGVVKQDYDSCCFTLLGGAAASYSHEEILKENGYLDAICYGEGEIPFRNLLSGKGDKWFNLIYPSWVTRQTIKLRIIPKISYVENLDDVIDIDYSFVDVSAYDTYQAFSPFTGHHKKHKQFFLMTSRGCPFECTFCSNSKIHGKKMRFASVDRVVSHARYLVERYGMNVLTMYDDQLLIDMPRAKELFCQLAPLKLRIECPNGLSASFIDKEMARLMKSAGMDTVYLAIENGSQYVLSTLMHKSLKLSQVKIAIETLQENNIFVLGFFVMGMPGETSEHRQETCQFIKDVGLDWASLQMATPFKGSQLYDMCVKNKWITKDTLKEIYAKAGGLFMETTINIPGIDSQEVNREVYEMNLDVNFHNNRRMKIGDYKTAARCFEEVLRRYPDHEIAKHYLKICEGKL